MDVLFAVLETGIVQIVLSKKIALLRKHKVKQTYGKVKKHQK